jgi:hypothetical protein
MQLKFFYILLILIAHNAILFTNSITINTKYLNKNTNKSNIIYTNQNNLNPAHNNDSKNSFLKENTKTQKKEKYHSQSFLEFLAKSKSQNKIKNQNPNFSYGNFDFAIGYQLLEEMLKSGILSDNRTILAQECFRNIYRKQSQFHRTLERFYSLMFAFYVSENFLKNVQSANENFINAMNQIKKILDEAQDNFVFLNGYRRNCYQAFKFVPNFTKDEILKILIKPEYFGEINNTYGAQPFIDSQFSIYRDRLPANSFKLLNYVSRRNNASGPSLIGKGAIDRNFINRLMFDARAEGLNKGFDRIEDGGYGNHFYGRKDYLYKPYITYELSKNGNNDKIYDYNIYPNNNNLNNDINNGNNNPNDHLKNNTNNSNLKVNSAEFNNNSRKNANEKTNFNNANDNLRVNNNKKNNPQSQNTDAQVNKEQKANENQNHDVKNSNYKININSKNEANEITIISENDNNKNQQENDDCFLDPDNIKALNNTQKNQDDNKHKNHNHDESFNLMVFGNVGEIEYFSALSKIATSAKDAAEELTSNIQKEKLSFDNQNNICYINFSEKDKLELNSTKGLVNFNSLLTSEKTIQKINAANSLFLLGEITSIGVPNIIYPSIAQGAKEKLLARVQCAWTLFLDSLSKTGFAQALEDGSFLVSQEVDILPGASTFQVGLAEKNLEIFDAIQRGKNISEDNAQILVEDVTNSAEQNSSTKKIRQHSQMLLDSPKMITLKFKDFFIQFLDFNSYMLICLSEETEAEYNKCLKKNNLIAAHSSDANLTKNSKKNSNIKSRGDSENQAEVEVELKKETEVETDKNDLAAQEKFLSESEKVKENKINNNTNNKTINDSYIGYKSNEIIFSFGNAKKYLSKLYSAIKEKFYIQSAQYPVWKFMRAVHAPVSSISGDSEFYFKMLKVINEKGSEEVVSLIDSMREKNVNLFISSQAKAAEVISFPYTRIFKKPEKNCNKEKAANFGCVYTRHNKIFTENANFFESAKCIKQQNSIEFVLPFNSKTVEKNQSVLYVFNIGNSGAGLEKIPIGKASNGYVIWERSIATGEEKDLKSANYGFANLAISKNFIEVNFYEMKGKNEVEKIAMFSVTEEIMPDQTIINSVIDENFCGGNIQ